MKASILDKLSQGFGTGGEKVRTPRQRLGAPASSQQVVIFKLECIARSKN